MDPSGSAQLARYCAYLPLTLHAAATHLDVEPDRSVAAEVGRLGDERRRLLRLGHADDLETDVRAVTSLSYGVLPPESQRLFRLLALHPASSGTAGVYSIARLVARNLGETEDLLGSLERESLISRTEDRYGSRHDVLHLYGRQLIEQDAYAIERRDSLDGLAHAYYGGVNHAFDRVNRDNPMVDVEFLACWRRDDPEGVATVDDAKPAVWFANEHQNLVALVRAAGDMTPPLAITPKLACSLFYFLETGGYFADWAAVEEVAERVAFSRDDLNDQARSLRNRARIILVKIQDDQERHHAYGGILPPAEGYVEAVEMLERSRRLFHAAYEEDGQRRNQAGEAVALRELADLHRLRAAAPGHSDAIDEAIDAYHDAERAFEALGNDNGLASLRLALGIAYTLRGEAADLQRAESCFYASLAYSRTPNEVGGPQHPRMMGYALRRLGDLYHGRDDFAEAISFYKQSIATFEKVKDANSKGRALAALGNLLADHGRNLHENDDQTGARDALADARVSFIEAISLLSASPHEARDLKGRLEYLDELEREWQLGKLGLACYSDDHERN